ncbi:MAG: hypothetical protein ACTSXH_00425 [Promethearchaeota archaeon]
MTETSNLFENIFFTIQKKNPNYSHKEIYKFIAKIITENYIQKINEITLKDELDKFKKAKLLKHVYRSPKKKRERIELKLLENAHVKKYKNLKSILFGSSNWYSNYNNFSYIIRIAKNFSKVDSNDSNDLFIIRKSFKQLKELNDYNSNFSKIIFKKNVEDIEEMAKNTDSLIAERLIINDENIYLEDYFTNKKKKIVSYLREKEKFDGIEPDNIFIMAEKYDDLFLDSEEEIESLLEDLDNTKFNQKLANFYDKYNNDIED